MNQVRFTGYNGKNTCTIMRVEISHGIGDRMRCLYSIGFLPEDAYLPVNGPPYFSLLEVKEKCFYLSAKWAFTGISGLR